VELIHGKKASMQELQVLPPPPPPMSWLVTRRLQDRVRVLDALQEIKNDDPDVSFLPQVQPELQPPQHAARTMCCPALLPAPSSLAAVLQGHSRQGRRAAR
jgi:hypothetical protein